MGRSLLLSAYLLFSRNAGGVARRTLAKRLAKGKEDPARIGERSGIASKARPEGQLIWIHAASVGESLSILELAKRLLDDLPDAHCMITTGTVTSAKALEGRMHPRMFHQYIPVDYMGAVTAFLEHWKPDLAVWTESEFWPALMHETHRRDIPMVLINARMSAKSYRSWRYMRGMAKSILGRFDYIMAQNSVTGGYLKGLGVKADRLDVSGSLKEGAAPLPHNESQRKALAGAINGRAVWLAASTHPGEEDMVVKAHKQARRSYPELLLILVPRHPERGGQIANDLIAEGCTVAQRTKDEQIDGHTDIYLADTIGEMGLWYRLSPVSFIGGSLVNIGGHNPFEPAALGSAILHGPYVTNFENAYARLSGANACIEVADSQSLAQTLEATLAPENAAQLATNAWAACSDGAEVTDKVLAKLFEYLAKEKS